MPSFLQSHYDTEGPFGLPMRDRQARSLDDLLKTLPRQAPYEPRKALVAKAPTEVLGGERADVSWISAESVDRQGDVVLSTGMDETHFLLNPLVTLQHAYWMPPVGRSLWRKRAVDGDLRGIKAKTQYFPRPDSWPTEQSWAPDTAFTLVQSGILRGKSIGFLPLQARRPTDEEIRAQPALAEARFIIEKWLLLEYACVYLPAQQHALVETVSKGLQLPHDFRKALQLTELPTRIAFTPFAEVEKAVQRRLAQLDLAQVFAGALQRSWSKLCGRV